MVVSLGVFVEGFKDPPCLLDVCAPMLNSGLGV